MVFRATNAVLFIIVFATFAVLPLAEIVEATTKEPIEKKDMAENARDLTAVPPNYEALSRTTTPSCTGPRLYSLYALKCCADHYIICIIGFFLFFFLVYTTTFICIERFFGATMRRVALEAELDFQERRDNFKMMFMAQVAAQNNN